MLEFIHLFVEVLDQYFGSVCELDLVFNFYKVYQILDEMVVGGEVMETSKLIINRAMKSADYYEWKISEGKAWQGREVVLSVMLKDIVAANIQTKREREIL